MARGKKAFSEEIDERVASINIIEFIADTEQELNARMNTLSYLEANKGKEASAASWYTTRDSSEISAVEFKKKGVGLLRVLQEKEGQSLCRRYRCT